MQKHIKYFSVLLMSGFYIYVGILHFIDPEWFLLIMPPFLSSIDLELIYISGFFEIVLGLSLLYSKSRKNFF